MTRSLLLSISLLALLAISPAPAAERPNIVYILADDFGYGDAGCYNPESKLPTPHIDRLAREGMRFTDAHSASAVCSPTRYGILTGRYPWRTRLKRGVLGPYDAPLIEDGRLTVAGLLKRHGYHTACVGKWHLGWTWPRDAGEVVFDRPIADGPTTRGFDTYFGTDVPNYPPYCFLRNDRTVGLPTAMKEVRNLDGRPGPMLPGWKFDAILPALAAESARIIGSRAKEDAPFFLYVPLTSPHEPIAPSERFRGKSGINVVGDFILETDWAVGQVLKALDEHELAANTLVFLTCDNGHAKYTGLEGLRQHGHEPSAHLRGYKADIYEGGHRVPFIARWPGTISPGTECDATICHNNLLATCAELLGATLPGDAGEDSFSILPLLRGEHPETPTHPQVVHHSSQGRLALREGRWKFIEPTPAGATKGAAANPTELYDLVADPSERQNLAEKHPDIVRSLEARLGTIRTAGRSRPLGD